MKQVTPTSYFKKLKKHLNYSSCQVQIPVTLLCCIMLTTAIIYAQRFPCYSVSNFKMYEGFQANKQKTLKHQQIKKQLF